MSGDNLQLIVVIHIRNDDSSPCSPYIGHTVRIFTAIVTRFDAPLQVSSKAVEDED